jgi:hypothetical protein
MMILIGARSASEVIDELGCYILPRYTAKLNRGCMVVIQNWLNQMYFLAA